MGKRKKVDLEVGKKYKGTGWINEYGQTFFEVTQREKDDNKMKLIKQCKSYSLYESKNLIKVSCTIEKNSDKVTMYKSFMDAWRAALVELKNYDIEI